MVERRHTNLRALVQVRLKSICLCSNPNYLRTHLTVKNALNEENEESLERVETSEQILEHNIHAVHETKEPRHTKDR